MTSIKNHIKFYVDLLTCLSIICAGILFIYDNYRSRITEINIALITASSNSMSLLVSNTGGVDVVIKEARVLVPEHEINNEINIGKLGTLIKHGDSRIVKSSNSKLNTSVIYDASKKPALITKVATSSCTIKIVFIDSHGKLISKEVKSSCIAACVPDELSG